MGTYTTNKNLFMPTVGETGWGTLVNGNFETIDTFLKPITLYGSTYTFTGNHVGNQSGGSVSATTGTFSGAVNAASLNGATITSTTFNGATIDASGNMTVRSVTTTVNKVITITPNSNYIAETHIGDATGDIFIMLPLAPPGYVYSGKIRLRNHSYWRNVEYSTEPSLTNIQSVRINQATTGDLSFTNAKCLILIQPQGEYITICGFTVS